MFTLDLNKFSLITNETCFTANTVHIDQVVHCANRDQNMLILILIGLPHNVFLLLKRRRKVERRQVER